MNWEKADMKRKSPIDFCFAIDGYDTIPLRKFLKNIDYEQKFCGVVKIPNARDVFSLFYDYKGHMCFADCMEESDKEHNKKMFKEKGETVGLGYKGIEKEDGVSNDLRLSSIPKGQKVICNFVYNKDSYVQHCKKYNDYQKWLKNRNMQRWVDIEEHGQKIDGKNMLHCMRLIDMSVEIAAGKGIIVRRPNAKELLDIRKGKVDLDTLISIAEEKIRLMDELFEKSNLPKKVDNKLIQKLEKKIRKEFFK
jgi:hypothetical protein